MNLHWLPMGTTASIVPLSLLYVYCSAAADIVKINSMHLKAGCLLATAKNCICVLLLLLSCLFGFTITCQRAPVLCGLAAPLYIMMTAQYIRQAVATVGRRRQLQPQSPKGNAVPGTNRLSGPHPRCCVHYIRVRLLCAVCGEGSLLVLGRARSVPDSLVP